jgi:hypothetical protein
VLLTERATVVILRGLIPPRDLRSRIFNPTREQWIGGALVLGVAAVATYAVVSGKPSAPALQGRPPGLPQGGAAPGACDLGPSYPGFAWDGVECAPSAATPPGIYVVDDCTDFIFVKGDDGPQPDDLEGRIATAIQSVSEAQEPGLGVSYVPNSDPTAIVTAFLTTFWPQCQWPPPPNGSQRIVQLYMALSVLVGRLIIEGGGSVLGTSSAAHVDEAIGDRLIELGFTEFHPEVVSEIELPEIIEPIPFHTVGTEFPEPPPKGGIELPGGQGAQPGFPGIPKCKTTTAVETAFRALPSQLWTAQVERAFKIWSPPSIQCNRYDLSVAVCLFPQTGFGLLDNYVGPVAPADAGSVIFQIQHDDGTGLEYDEWQQFRMQLVAKARLKIRVNVAKNGALSYGGIPTNVDPTEACPQAAHWPPTNRYRVMGTDGHWKFWVPHPTFGLSLDGNEVVLHVRYAGLPQFRLAGDDTPNVPMTPGHHTVVASLDGVTVFQNLSVRTSAIGV